MLSNKVRTKSVNLWSVELVHNGQSHFSSDGLALLPSRLKRRHTSDEFFGKILQGAIPFVFVQSRFVGVSLPICSHHNVAFIQRRRRFQCFHVSDTPVFFNEEYYVNGSFRVIFRWQSSDNVYAGICIDT